MEKIVPWLNDSLYTVPLPPACKMCADGSKMVILITGLCPANCFYCPLSSKKSGKDRIFADEWELDDEKDTEKLILEAEYIKATGAGITGGDPLVVWKRAKNYISLLKEKFGENFDIHLYTSGLKNGTHVKDLVDAGLDEIRFHPMPKYWGNMQKSPISKVIKNALNTGCKVAIEIPIIPNMGDEIFSLVKWANGMGINWINLNELEYSETNAEYLNAKGYTVKDDVSSAVLGSQETAYDVIKKSSEENLKIGVHYCSSSFKDGIQLRNRIKRRAESIVKDHEIISDDGTLIKGVVYSQACQLKEIYNLIKRKFDIEEGDIFINQEKGRIEIGIWVLEKIAGDLKKQGFQCFMVEEYPTADSLEVERAPMPL